MQGAPADRPPLPPDVERVVATLVERLRDALGEDLAGVFVYGALAFAHPPSWRADLDFHALVRQPVGAGARARIRAVYDDLAAHDLDGYVVTIDDARRPAPPVHQVDPRVRDDAWALHRAHVHAGRFFLVDGVDPRSIVPPSTWDELVVALHGQLHFVEAHPEHTAYGILNACRIAYSIEHHDVVVSKYDAAQWARDAFPAELQPAVDAAVRAYAGEPQPNDDARMAAHRDAIIDNARDLLRRA
jgi:hypothetical protein